MQSGKFELTLSKIDLKLAELAGIVKINNEIINEWADRIEPISLSFDFSELEKVSTDLLLECATLISTKQKDLLSTTDLTKLNELLEQIFGGLDFTEYNKAVADFNKAIKSFISGLASDSTQSLQSRIDNIKETKLRFTTDVIDDLENHKIFSDKKSCKTNKIKELRKEIDQE
jgi:hypothetical protein